MFLLAYTSYCVRDVCVYVCVRACARARAHTYTSIPLLSYTIKSMVTRYPCVFFIIVSLHMRHGSRGSPSFSQLIRYTRVLAYHYNMVYGLLRGRSWHNIQNACLSFENV